MMAEDIIRNIKWLLSPSEWREGVAKARAKGVARKESRPDGLLRHCERHSAKRARSIACEREQWALRVPAVSTNAHFHTDFRMKIDGMRAHPAAHHIGAPQKKSVFQRIKCMDCGVISFQCLAMAFSMYLRVYNNNSRTSILSRCCRYRCTHAHARSPASSVFRMYK